MNETNSNDTVSKIKVSVIKPSKESRFNTIKLLELYGNMEDNLNGILNKECPLPEYDYIIKTYECAESYRVVDPDLHDALIATCMYQTYRQVMTDDDPSALMDEVTDAKGAARSKLNLNSLANYLIKNYCIISHNSIPYLYIGNQYYADERKERLKKDITKILKRLNYSDHAKVNDISKDIIDRVINETQKLREYPFNNLSSELIPVIDGVVDRKTMTLLPHSPAFKMLYRLNAAFRPKLDPKPVNDYLNSLVEVKEDADLLLQITAQALLQDSQYQLAYIFTGDGSNGKSLFISFMENFIGKHNYTSISLHTITENKFARASLEGKLLNLYPDLEKNAVKYLGIFKALTGADEVQVERKFGAPFQLRNKAVFCFASNELPEVTDATYAFWRRICVIPFPNKFSPDPLFINTVITEENMSIFLNLIINKMNRIEQQGLTRSNRVEEAARMWKARSSSAYAFVQDCMVKDTEGKILKVNLENLYYAYCEEKDLSRQDFKNVTSELIKLGVIPVRTRDKEQKMTWIYRGCKYVKKEVAYMNVNDDEPEPELKMKEEI
jgi:P4 family phage/plasmid primase-like protien